MNENKIMPERYYHLDKHMSLNKIYRAKSTGDFLVAKVLSWDSEESSLRVDLGNDFYGKIPVEDFCMSSPRRSNGSLSPAVYSHIGKIVCVCVKEITHDNLIILSRKDNIIKAFNHIVDSFSHSETKVVTCSIEASISYGVFVDVGHGVEGLIHISNFCLSRVDNISDIGFSIGELITAKIISINLNNFHVELNYKCQFDNISTKLNKGDIIEAIVLHPINEIEDGYFVYLNPSTSAIMNPPPNLKIPYGSKVTAYVRNFSAKNPSKTRLLFISFIS